METYAPPTRLTLLSHAATSAQRSAAFPDDEPIEPDARDRLSSLRWQPPRVQQTWCSPECRARQTAEALHLSAATADELSECDYGSWRGLDMEKVQSQQPDGLMQWLTDPSAAPHGGESTAQFLARIAAWVDARQGTGHSLVVAHGSVIRAVVLHALHLPAERYWHLDVAPATLTDVRFNGRAWTLRKFGCSLLEPGD